MKSTTYILIITAIELTSTNDALISTVCCSSPRETKRCFFFTEYTMNLIKFYMYVLNVHQIIG